jgi:hypothetical protein
MAETFQIRHSPGNRDNSLPQHWDIFINGNDDSIITIWESSEMARECVKFLEQYPQRRQSDGVA